MNFKVSFYHESEEWYLSKLGNITLLHTYHPRIVDDANQLNEDDLDSTQVQYLRMMYEQGVPHSSIADVMSEVMKQKGKKGAFSSNSEEHHRKGAKSYGCCHWNKLIVVGCKEDTKSIQMHL